MKNLPLFYYPTTWVYVDDDKTLLDCMALAFKENGYYKTFSSPRDCLDFFNQYQSVTAQKNFLSSNMRDEYYGILKHTQIDFDITKIAHLADDPNRYHDITAMLIDYHMPEMDGFSLSQACGYSSFGKILLTGNADDEKIISGFNHNYIQHCICKGIADLEAAVIQQMKASSFQYFQKITFSLLAHLEAENPLPLSDAVFVDFFLDYCEKNNIREYYLIDKQGSYLCIDDKQKHSYFVVHTDRSINNWLETYYTGTEFSLDFFESIEDRHKLPFFGMGVEAWKLEPTEWHTYFHRPEGVLMGREKYYWFGVDHNEF